MEEHNATALFSKASADGSESKGLYVCLSYTVIGRGRTLPNETTMTAYTNTVSDVIEMFTDAAAGESTEYNRLVTLPLPNGNTGLIGYGEKTLAEYDEAEGRVTVYLGHKVGGGETITRWLNAVTDESAARRDVTFSDDAPWFRPPNAEAAQYIGAYIDFEDKSAVEQKAEKSVIESLRFLNDYLL